METGYMGAGATRDGGRTPLGLGKMGCGANREAVKPATETPKTPSVEEKKAFELVQEVLESAKTPVTELFETPIVEEVLESAAVFETPIVEEVLESTGSSNKVDVTIEQTAALEKLYPSQLKKMALEKDHKGADFSKVALINFLKTN